MADEPTPPTPMEPTMLFHQDGRTHIALTRSEYALLLEQGWKDSPVAFGVISAPSAEQRAQMPGPAHPALSGPDPQEKEAFSHLLLQWQKKIDMVEKRVQEVAQALERQRTQGQGLHESFTSMNDRLQALERAHIQQQGPATAPHDEPPARPRGREPRGE